MTTEKDRRQGGRFYDAEKNVQQALELMLMFPNYIQEIIARGLSMIAIKDFKLDMKLRTIGAEHVLSLYKSKFKRRTTDVNQNFHTALNHLRLLSVAERKLVSEKIIELASYIDFYRADCAELKEDRKAKDITEIRDNYVKWGPEKALEFVNHVREDVMNQRQNSLRTEVSFDGGSIHLESG